MKQQLLLRLKRLAEGELSPSERTEALRTVADMETGDFAELLSSMEEDDTGLSAHFGGIERLTLIKGLISNLPSPHEGETDPGVGRAWMLVFMGWAAGDQKVALLAGSTQFRFLPYVLRYPHIARAFTSLFAPPPDAAPASRFWAQLNLSTLQFHASDSTSFTLLAERSDAAIGERPVELKCLQLRLSADHLERIRSEKAYSDFMARVGGRNSKSAPHVYASTASWVAMEFKPVQVEDLLRGILALSASDLSSTDGRQVLKELSELAKADFRALISLVEEEGGTVQARFSVRREVLISRLLEMLPPPDEGETTPGVGRAWMLAFIAWVAEHRASSSIPSSDTSSVLLDALRHDHVAQAFAVLFAPDRTDTAEALRLWGSLNMTTLRFHAFGTTSYILAIRQKSTDKHIALKCLQLRFGAEHEVRRAARKAHADFETYRVHRPGVLDVVPEVLASTSDWIAMEFIAGPTLREWLNAWTNVPLERSEAASRTGATVEKVQRSPAKPWPSIEVLKTISIPLATSLACIHQHGLCHEDLTPSNVILEGNRSDFLPPETIQTTGADALRLAMTGINRVRLIDLGPNFAWTRSVDAQYPDAAFIANEDPSIRSDMFSLGMIIRELAGPADTSGAAIRLTVYRDQPMLGRLLDDLLDQNAARRLLLDVAALDPPKGKHPTDGFLSASLADRLRSVIEEEDRFAGPPSRIERFLGFRWWLWKLVREWWREGEMTGRGMRWSLSNLVKGWHGQQKEGLRGYPTQRLKSDGRNHRTKHEGTSPEETSPEEVPEMAPQDTDARSSTNGPWASPSSVLGITIARLAIWAALSGLAATIAVSLTIGGLVADYLHRAPGFLHFLFSFVNVGSFGMLRGPLAAVGRIRQNTPAHLVGFSFALPGLAYYQVLFAFLGPYKATGHQSRYGRRLFAILIRFWTVLPLLLIGTAAIFEPSWWIALSAAGIFMLSLTNNVAWFFEKRIWEAARADLQIRESDELEYRDPARDFFRNWGITSAGYFAALLGLFVLQRRGRLHDIGLYEAVIFGVNILSLYYNSLLRLGETVRARMTRAFALEERLTLARKRGLCGAPRQQTATVHPARKAVTETAVHTHQ